MEHKTFGKYKDCSGKEQVLDAFHMHEIIDRTHMIRMLFADAVEDHPAAALFKNDIEKIGILLSELYQKIGSVRFED